MLKLMQLKRVSALKSIGNFSKCDQKHSSNLIFPERTVSRTISGICINGIFPPITTPFNKSEEIAYDHLYGNLSKMESIPFSGYAVHGSTGEAVSLSFDERINVVKFVKSKISPGKVLIAGTGMESTKATIELTCKMADVGAAAALVVSPSFYKGRMTDEALCSYYMKVADASPIPVILYSVPANTSIDLPVPVIDKLSEHSNIIGLKDSGGDITKISLIVHKTKGKDFQVVAGSAGFLYPALCSGCTGGVLALANSLGKETCDLYQLFLAGKHEECQKLQHRLIGPNLSVTKKFGIAGVKHSMDLRGLYGGPTRSPLLPLNEKERHTLQEEFKQNGFL